MQSSSKPPAKERSSISPPGSFYFGADGSAGNSSEDQRPRGRLGSRGNGRLCRQVYVQVEIFKYN